ncbi:MAG: hypothetical protein K2Q17_13340 [Nitrospiraceae bacterium]|jgi:hypothetical protein|nr:hypothetical protein [Nitrospiraceae bacterium]
MDSHLNFFVPYENAAAWHENQLTRALLVLLRYSPMAHQAWLHLVAPGKHLHDLSKAEFAVQRQRILNTDTEMPDGEAILGISVWLAPDAVPVGTPIESSDRLQVLDGIVTYGTDLVVVIENKVAWGGVTEQPHRINLHGSPVIFEEKPRSVTWQHLLEVLADLVDRDLVPRAEQLLISDFFDLVEEHFPLIGPYSTLARCGEKSFRIERRLDTILGEAVGTSMGKARGARDLSGTAKIAMAWLVFANNNVCLRMYPADTLTQARALYCDRSALNAVLALQSDGWHVEPNFHWGFMATGYAWVTTPLQVEKYCDYWASEIGATRELPRSEWETYWTKLESAQIIEATGKEKFDAHFTGSQRQKAHPRPGLFCEYRWPLEEARQFDARGKFSEKVRVRLNQMLTALNDPPIASRSGIP